MDIEREEALLVFFDGVLSGEFDIDDSPDFLIRIGLGPSKPVTHDENWTYFDEDTAFLHSLLWQIEATIEHYAQVSVRLRGAFLRKAVDQLIKGNAIFFAHPKGGGIPVVFTYGHSSRGRAYLTYRSFIQNLCKIDPFGEHDWVRRKLSLDKKQQFLRQRVDGTWDRVDVRENCKHWYPYQEEYWRRGELFPPFSGERPPAIQPWEPYVPWIFISEPVDTWWDRQQMER